MYWKYTWWWKFIYLDKKITTWSLINHWGKLENRNFNKKHSKILSIGHEEVQYQIKPIEIIVPIMKFIDVEIPMLNIGGSNKQYEEEND